MGPPPPGLPQTPAARVHLRPPARGEVREEERQVEVDHPPIGHDLARHLSHRPQGGGLSRGHHVEGGSGFGIDPDKNQKKATSRKKDFFSTLILGFYDYCQIGGKTTTLKGNGTCLHMPMNVITNHATKLNFEGYIGPLIYVRFVMIHEGKK